MGRREDLDIGYGDELMGAGMARGAAAQGRRVAFGDGRRIRWNKIADIVYQGNPNVARPGSEGAKDLVWIKHYPGQRAYHATPNRVAGHWRYNQKFRAVPGEIYYTDDELRFAESVEPGFVLIEPNTKQRAVNKQWGIKKWKALVGALNIGRFRVVQFDYGAPLLPGVEHIRVPSFRAAVAAMARGRFCVLPEGGLHHGAAAAGLPGVVIFGGFTPPLLTGYDLHVNLAGSDKFCGSIEPCQHCRKAMDAITVEQVWDAITRTRWNYEPVRSADSTK